MTIRLISLLVAIGFMVYCYFLGTNSTVQWFTAVTVAIIGGAAIFIALWAFIENVILDIMKGFKRGW